MTKAEFHAIENHMLRLMRDSAHDRHHIYRVLNLAVDIAATCEGVDADILLAACLLHDIGRERQRQDVRLCHAREGGEMAYELLLSLGWAAERAAHVRACISSHRFRGDNPPESIEAKILFDADKLDVCGTIGIARTLIYAGQIGAPLYVPDGKGGFLTERGGDDSSSFFQEYHYKLSRLYDVFYTDRARALAQQRRRAAEDFYTSLYSEVAQTYGVGEILLEQTLRG